MRAWMLAPLVSLVPSLFDAPPRVAADDPFPAATSGLAVPTREAESWTVLRLLQEYEALTAQRLVLSEDVRAVLEHRRVPLGDTLEIAAADVHSVVESLCLDSGVSFTLLREASPRLLLVSVREVHDQGIVRSRAPYVAADDLDAWRAHPAHVVRSVLTLEHVEVRKLANSLRAFFTDANREQLVPLGDTNSLVLTGYAPVIADLVDTLRAIDAAEGEARKNAPEPAEETD